MIRVYTNEQIELIAKRLGFDYAVKLKGFLANDYDLFDSRTDGLEDNAEIVEAEKEFFDCKIGQLKNEFAYNSTEPTEKQILKVISIVKQLNIDYLLNRYQGKIEKQIAGNLVLYGYTHGKCNSLAYSIYSLFEGCKLKTFKGGEYCHQVVEFNGKIYDINGCSTIEEMQEFVANEGHVPVESCIIEDSQPIPSKHGLLDFAVTKYIGEYIERCAEQKKETGKKL